MLNVWAKVALVLTSSANACLIIGVASTEWLFDDGGFQGIWERCDYRNDTKGLKQCVMLEDTPEFDLWVRWVRAFEMSSYGLVWVVIALLFLYLVRTDGPLHATWIKVAIPFCLLSVLLCLGGIALFTVKTLQPEVFPDKRFGWSYMLTSVGGGIMVPVVLFLVFELKTRQRYDQYQPVVTAHSEGDLFS